ncbi:LytR C-terminal domain-containing protein [Massilia sp. Dwa41.01b]|uniref:LytR C-terminal domain-containing protein n=1 Tax=unclassified Massilia TaxID=2609279 RepID=UPI0015FFB6C0|nr:MULTISPECIES: LytR C-terminal domain-containing protein [unclassified Massilia]QNA90789.1 LytR C-terminal domain-containing protein [Massilia sp. Dwa41.01b]QNA98025.1 LytR C-terminal domain-containing protein [Massilia sp. Se16.2.3]
MSSCKILKKMSVLCAGAMLLACADMSHQVEQPVVGVDANLAYDQGRAHHVAGRYDDAIASYRAALVTAPHHVQARNALAAAFARQGEFARAIPIWQGLTAELKPDGGPGGAYLFANLGYAYLLGGDYQNAVVALEKACVLDPLDHRAWHNLGETLRRLGQDERAERMFRQASALRDHDFQRDYTVAGGTAVAAIQVAVAAPVRAEREWAATEVRTTADGMLELVRLPSQRAIAQALPAREPDPLPAPPPRTRPDVVLVEIRNGNGVTGMARALSRQVDGDGLQVTRLSNEKGFKVRRTRIEHGPAHRDAAQRLAERFDDVQLVEVVTCTSTDLRLVLGQDMARGKLVLRTPLRDSDRFAAADAVPKAP